MPGPAPEIPGPKVTDLPSLNELRWEVASLLGRNNEKFPGAQPVSFAKRHIEELKKQDYYVCEKTDGMRCLMYILVHEGKEVTYLIDRNNDYHQVNHIHFPKPDTPEGGSSSFHPCTILDGELVIDVFPGRLPQMVYLVFDMMMLDGETCMHRTLDKRLAYFRDYVYGPYVKYRSSHPEDHAADFIVDWKKMEMGYGTEQMFKETLPKLPHGSDGLIFTCRTTPYQFGTDQHILKWKPAHENSIDFRMILDFPPVDPDSDDEDPNSYPNYSAQPNITLVVNGGDRRGDIVYGTMVLDDSQWEAWKGLGQPLNDRIVECSLIESSTWRFLRFRDDKPEANHISTVESVMESIQDKVSEEDLIRASKSIRDEWKEREKQAAMARASTNGQHAAR